ncbi:MAG: AAA family ATPase, partial [bacterium]|nr:AAA family ATPase [bacterium]
MIPRIRSVQIRNYKSLTDVSVELEPLTILVGPNGVGPPMPIGIRLVLDLVDDISAEYVLEIDPVPEPGFRIVQEWCSVKCAKGNEVYEFAVRDGVFSTPIPGIRPRVSPNRLALYAASATEEFLPVFDFLTTMHFYAIAPERIRKLQEPDPGEFLRPDGSNAAVILRRLQTLQPTHGDIYHRLCELLSVIAQGVSRVEYKSVGRMETLAFKQDLDDRQSFDFDALNMSDGTLRMLGLLLAIYQPAEVSVVGIEEPEATVHPGV